MTRTVVAWCLYDLANTIFAMNITSYHYPLWIVGARGASELAYGVAFGASMLASAALMPWAGRSGDRAGSHAAGLLLWTLGCVALTIGLAWNVPAMFSLAVFAAANVCYQVAGVFYNALLPAVAPSGRRGWVSGAGVALGYCGTVIGIAATGPLVARYGRPAAFVATGLLFLLLALPSFLWAPRAPAAPAVPRAGLLREQPRLKKFLWAAFWGLNAVNTVILFMSVYAQQAAGFTDAELDRFLIVSSLSAIAGSFAWGLLCDRRGGYRTLWWVWLCWCATFCLAAWTTDKRVFWVTGSLAGICLGGTWVSSRVLLVEWVRPERAGEAFGLFGLVTRLSGILGPLVWGLALKAAAGWGASRYRLGMACMLLFVLAGWSLYHRIGDDDRMNR